MKETSNTWLESLKSGGPDASGWRILLDSYGPFVRRILTQSGLPQDAVDDVSQNVMTVVSTKLAVFERKRTGSFRAWLRLITGNCLRDHLKSKQYRRRGVGGTDMLNLAKAMEDSRSEFSKMWNLEHTRHVIDQLLEAVSVEFSNDAMECFRRLALNDDPLVDVSHDLGMTANACIVSRSRVLKRLKSLMRELFGEDEALLDLLP